MNRLERIHAIDEMIARHGIVPVETFLSTLKISLATFKRDLDYLRSRLNAPLVWDRASGGYRYGNTRRGKVQVAVVPALWSGSRDTQALLSAHAALAQIRSGPMKAEAEALCARLLVLLSAHGDSPSQIAKRIRTDDAAALSADEPFFPSLANAVLKRRRVRIQLRNQRKKAVSMLEVSPQGLVHQNGAWVLEATEHPSGKACRILLGDLESVDVLNEKAR